MSEEQEVYKGVEEVADLLERTGREIRSRDLSEPAARRARAEVDGLLKDGSAAHQFIVPFSRRSLVVAAAGILILAGIIIHRSVRTDRPLGPVGGVGLEREIDARRRDLAYQFEQFKSRLERRNAPGAYERRASDLKQRLDLRRIMLEEELESARAGTGENTACLELERSILLRDKDDGKEG